MSNFPDYADWPDYSSDTCLRPALIGITPKNQTAMHFQHISCPETFSPTSFEDERLTLPPYWKHKSAERVWSHELAATANSWPQFHQPTTRLIGSPIN